VSDRGDILKSWLQRAAQAGASRLSRLDPVQRVSRAVEELRARRVRLDEATLAQALSAVEGLRESTLQVRDGRIEIDACWQDGERLAFAAVPETIRFAPRGAKEVLFRVEPAELARKGKVREAVGALAGAVAFAVWGPLLGAGATANPALVETEGQRLRADLRSIAAVRSALSGGPLGQVLDVLSIERFELADRELRVILKLPMPGGPV
jgi:hypothetical protein